MTAADITARTDVPTERRDLSGVAGHPTLLGRVGAWWRARCERRATLAAFDLWSPSELASLAGDAVVPSGELRVQAGKWPDAADLLRPRLATLGLELATIERDAPAVLRDLQRVCANCVHKGGCKHDLAAPSDAARWRTYCLNAGTLDAMRREPAKSSATDDMEGAALRVLSDDDITD